MKNPPKTVSQALAILQRINRFLGIQCFERNGKPLLIISLLYVTTLAMGYCALIHFGYDHYLQSKVLKFERIMAVFLMYANVMATISLSLFGCFFTKTYKCILTRIDRVDNTLEKLRSSTDNRKIYVRSFQGIVCYFLYQIIFNSVNAAWALKDYGVSTAVYITVIYVHSQNLSYFVVLTFSMLVACLEVRFKRINDLLYQELTTLRFSHKWHTIGVYASKLISVTPKLYPEADRLKKNRETLRRSTHMIRTTKQLHLELCKIARELCNSFGFQLLGIVALNVIVIINLLFNLYNRFVTLAISNMGKLKRTILTIPLCALYVGQLILLNRTCESAGKMANKAAEIFHELHGLIDDTTTRDEAKQFSLQLMQRPLEFSPLGFLHLNNNFMRALVGSITTYAVILIQVGDDWLEQSNGNTSSLFQNFSSSESS